jgi:NfeD-like.
MIVEWWDGLDGILKMLYCIAVPATLVLLIQTVLSLHGGFEGGGGVDVSDTSGLDFHDGSHIANSDTDWDHTLGDGGNPADFSIMSMLTLQGLATFLTVMGWSSIAAISTGTSATLSIIVGLVLGFAAMYAAARLIHASRRLAESGTLDLRHAVGETGRVYIPIPAEGKGEGKITMQLQGRYIECSAITFENKLLPTGEMVRVTDVRNELLIVEEDQ